MKIVSAAEAVAEIRSGDRVYVQCAAAAPSVLLDALVARAPELRDVDVVHLHIERPGPHLAPEMAGHFRHTALFIRPNPRAAVALCLRDKRNLGVHTELMTDCVVDLVEAGAVTGLAKERNRGKIVATFMMGTQKLYRFVHDNPMVEMHATYYTNDTHVIRGFSRMTAINSAIAIDLTGQVCADSIGTRLYSGVGGQMDFIRGAALATQGRPIIALPSTAAGGTVSRITPFLAEGSGVVTTRAHVRTVVTEWGVAELYGKSIRERAAALIGIAHPDFRDELTVQARRTHYL